MNPSSKHTDNLLPDAAPSGAILQFRHDQRNSGVSRHGMLHPGERLRVEYDPSRLNAERETSVTDVVCNVRFNPSGEYRSGNLVQPPRPVRSRSRARPLMFESTIPSGTTAVEVWFEGRGSTGTIGWDSRFGQNYTFGVAERGLPIPEQSVVLRPGAEIDATRIRVIEDAAGKEQIAIGGSGTRLRTGLFVRALIQGRSEATSAWADVHVFDATDDLIHSGTITLQQVESESAEEALRFWDAEVYQGSGGASGMGVWARPDAHAIQYRVYCQIDDEVYTNGVLHQFHLPADTEVRPTSGGW